MLKWILPLLLWASTALAQNITCPTRPVGDNSNACASTAFVQQNGALNVGTSPVNGGVSGRILYDNAGVLGERVPTGNGANVATSTGTLTSGDCVKIDAAGNLVDSGSACSAGGGITQLTTDVTAGPGSGSQVATIAANAVTNAKMATAGANTMKGNWTASTANLSDNTMPSCTDTGGNHLNYVNGTGITCGTSTGAASGSLVSIITYSGSQTITIPAAATKAFIRMRGGTGGSAGTTAGGGTTGGTGGPGYLEKYLTGLTPGNTVVYTQGGAGSAGPSGGASPGGNGGASTLASGTQTITTLTANGSNGSIVGSLTNGTAGGTATNGDLNITGQNGSDGFDAVTANHSGIGGSSPWGVGANGVTSGGATAGNAGITGALIIMWFSWNFPANDNLPFAQVA